MASGDRVALVTGGGRGLGWGIARAFGLAGWKVWVTDVNEEELAECAADLEADRAEFMTAISDVADREACQGLVADIVGRWGRLDAVVHNAIYMPLVTFDDTTPEEWDRQLDVGLGGMFNLTHAAWEQMKGQGSGHIIGVASGSSFRGFKEEIAYCTIKHGVEGFVKALSLESAGYDIALNTIGPGAPIKPTRMTRAELESLPEEEKAEWADPLQLGRAFVWLASQPPARINGYRLDAGPIVQTIDREGEDFEFSPEKVTMYPDDFEAVKTGTRTIRVSRVVFGLAKHPGKQVARPA
ncbi:MAG: SDR family oxidoreductase [Thermomicrobiales bacterium]